MFYKFDNYGWYVGPTEAHIAYSTEVPPPNSYDSSIVPNWTGTTWQLMTYVAPQPVLSDVQANQIALISQACGNAIISGFTSSALGTPHQYPSKSTDQQNLASSVLSSIYPNLPTGWTTPFWCADGNGNWTFVPHTAAQIQQAGIDGKTQILAYMTKNDTLKQQILSATSVADVLAITW